MPHSLAEPHADMYPLQRRLLVWGLVVATTGGILFLSPLAGFAFLVLFGAVGALWRRDEAPILVFCIAYQWFFIVTGYFYQQITGRYPGLPAVGDLQGAVLLS